MVTKTEFFKKALASLERGETLRDIRPFRALAATTLGRRGRQRPDEVEDLAQDLLAGLVALRRARSESWRAFLACDEEQARRQLVRRLRWIILDRVGRAPELDPLDELPREQEPVDAGTEKRIRRTIDGGRAAQRALGTLTERERQVLLLRAKGESVEETARIVGTGRSTVYELQKSVARKVDGGGRRTSRGTRREALRQLAVAVTAKAKNGK